MSCSASGCTKRHSKGSSVNFFRYPLGDNERLKQWLKNVRRKNWTPSNSSRLCSTHFEEDQFFIDKEGKRRLKDTAVPTIFVFQSHWLIEDVPAPDTQTNSLSMIDIDGSYHNIPFPNQGPVEETSVDESLLGDDIIKVIVGAGIDEDDVDDDVVDDAVVVADDGDDATECTTSTRGTQTAMHDHTYRCRKQQQISVGTDHNYVVAGSPRTLKRKADAVQDQLVIAHKKLKLKCQETRRMKSRLLSLKNLTKVLKKKLKSVEKALAAAHK